MRILALDYGSARCGCAVSDPSGMIARPIDVVEDAATESGIARIAAISVKLDIEQIVVGLPTTLSGEVGRQAAETLKFVDLLRDKVSVGVETYDERFTTSLAKKTKKDTAQAGAPAKASEDSIAAAHLLTGYLAENESS